jgi:hypothetical protein
MRTQIVIPSAAKNLLFAYGSTEAVGEKQIPLRLRRFGMTMVS